MSDFFTYCFCSSRKKSSLIWEFFAHCKDDPTSIVCKCGVKASNKNISNASSHIHLHHNSEVAKLLQKINMKNVESASVTESEPDETTNTNFSPRPLNSNLPAATVNVEIVNENITDSFVREKQAKKSPVVNLKQTSMRKVLKRRRACYGVKSARKKQLDCNLMKMIISTRSSLNIVENLEFQKFTQDLDERYAVPSRNTVAKPILNALHNKLSKKVKDMLNSTQGY